MFNSRVVDIYRSLSARPFWMASKSKTRNLQIERNSTTPEKYKVAQAKYKEKLRPCIFQVESIFAAFWYHYHAGNDRSGKPKYIHFIYLNKFYDFLVGKMGGRISQKAKRNRAVLQPLEEYES